MNREEQANLFPNEGLDTRDSGPVTCLGQTFENDNARRAHFTEELRQKLQDPEFRKIEGFPIGEDEDILKLSDPPYYTACPNPWVGQFIGEWEAWKNSDEGREARGEKQGSNHSPLTTRHYHREPFAADVSEGKNDPIYNAHSYHTKVPHKAIMRYILHYTEPGDIVFDGFCGTGMTGVAAQSLNIPESSMDYIFLDPPFGANIMYSELSYIREAWLKVFTNNEPEAIENKTQKKGIDEYRKLMTDCFATAFKYLKPGCWMTVEFSNTKASVWNSIQNALSDVGFIVASVAALDKTRGGLHAMLGPTAVKQDLVISAYKPNGGFEERFEQEAQTEKGVWDFIRTHLKYLPVTKKLGLDLVAIPERDPRILYDQVIAYYVRKGYNIPIDSQEFQLGLSQRFSERDGMYFLPEQVAEYDRKKMIGGGRPLQQSLFVHDESSAIEWLRNLLRDKQQSFQDINPQFMKEIGGWSKNEVGLELSTLLEQNFLCYEGKSDVPSQIHGHLSTWYKELRNLAKDDPALIAKAKGRWYVPDPNKAGDLEKLREKSLLKEFEEYKQAKKKLKIFRLEAVRAGFKKAWLERDYKVIITVAEKIPNNVLEEDPKLLMWYDQAVTRVGGE